MSNKENTELLEFLQEMISKYPNDQELGKEIRKFLLSKSKPSNTK